MSIWKINFCGTLHSEWRYKRLLREGIGHSKTVINHHQNMNNRLLSLFEKTARLVFSLECTCALILLLTVSPVTSRAQSVALDQVSSKSEQSSVAANQKVSGGMLGVYLGDINEARARDLKLAEARGVVVGQVEQGSPAAKAGLQENDVIVTFNDRPVINPTQFYQLLTESSAGVTVALGIYRAGVSQTVRAVLGQRPTALRRQNENIYATADAYLVTATEREREVLEARQRGDEKEAARLGAEAREFRKLSDDSRAAVDKDIREGRVRIPSAAKANGNSVAAARYQLGVRVSSLSEQLGTFFNVRNGVLVNEVRVGGAAESAGIKAGDCIVAVSGERIESLVDLNRLIDQASDNGLGEVALGVVRERMELTIKVKFGSR